MVLPNNGKVVIIDDEPEDVRELISVLSKEKVPFVYYKEKNLSDLPDTPLENVRLVFLDLELVTKTYPGGHKNITGPIKSRLQKILTPKCPYGLVIWSKKESKYKHELLKDFDGEFQDYKPIFHTSMPKANILKQKVEALKLIKDELEKEIQKFDSFNAFLIWEGIVNQNSGKLTNSLVTSYPLDDLWNDKTKFLLYELAHAYSGKAVDGFGDVKQLKNALYTLTYSFNENIESSIDKAINDNFKGLVNKNHQSIGDFSSAINKLLLISESSDDHSQPGNLFFPLDEVSKEEALANDKWEKFKAGVDKIKPEKVDEASKNAEARYNSRIQEIQKAHRGITSLKNDIVISSTPEEVYSNKSLKKEILTSAIPIDLNITPLCDYAQKKATLFRILPGVLLESKYRQHLNSTAYTYVSDANFNINGNDFLFLFDFRYLHAITNEQLSNRIVKLRLKQQLLSDIQVKLGSHINRAGVLYLS